MNNTIRTLLVICICIELWHIVYYIFLYDKYFRRIENIINCAKSFDDLHNSVMRFVECYLYSIDVQDKLGFDFSHSLRTILHFLRHTGDRISKRQEILQLCSLKQMFSFLFQQTVEVLYLIVSYIVILSITLTVSYHIGIILFIILIIVKKLKRCVNNNAFLLTIISVFCISIFSLIVCKFF